MRNDTVTITYQCNIKYETFNILNIIFELVSRKHSMGKRVDLQIEIIYY